MLKPDKFLGSYSFTVYSFIFEKNQKVIDPNRELTVVVVESPPLSVAVTVQVIVSEPSLLEAASRSHSFNICQIENVFMLSLNRYI